LLIENACSPHVLLQWQDSYHYTLTGPGCPDGPAAVRELRRGAPRSRGGADLHHSAWIEYAERRERDPIDAVQARRVANDRRRTMCGGAGGQWPRRTGPNVTSRQLPICTGSASVAEAERASHGIGDSPGVSRSWAHRD
jgi:hypothetical protein